VGVADGVPGVFGEGIATHILGDDLSLLSRQRDGAVQVSS